MLLDSSGRIEGHYLGNIRSVINTLNPSKGIQQLLALLKVDIEYDHIVMAIDAPLGFPNEFRELLNSKASKSKIEDFAENGYLFRKCEQILRRIEQKKKMKPLSTINDRIGSHATKAMAFMLKMEAKVESVGVWQKKEKLTIIETYPTINRDKIDFEEFEKIKSYNQDLEDAFVCAKVAEAFKENRKSLVSPPKSDDIIKEEGWIWYLKNETT